MGRLSPQHANTPSFPLIPCENHLFLSARSDVRSVLPKSLIHLSFHADWRGWGRNNVHLSYLVCQRYAFAFPSGRVGSLRGQNGHFSHIPPTSAARQLPGVISQGP